MAILILFPVQMNGTISSEKMPMMTVKPPNGTRNPSSFTQSLEKNVKANGKTPRNKQTMTKASLASWENASINCHYQHKYPTWA